MRLLRGVGVRALAPASYRWIAKEVFARGKSSTGRFRSETSSTSMQLKANACQGRTSLGHAYCSVGVVKVSEFNITVKVAAGTDAG